VVKTLGTEWDPLFGNDAGQARRSVTRKRRIEKLAEGPVEPPPPHEPFPPIEPKPGPRSR
jgi:hypothetical protein